MFLYYKYFKLWLLGTIFLTASFTSSACFTIIAGKAATASRSIILARNSDSKDARRSKNYKIYLDENGHKLYTGLPYSDIEFNPGHDMAQVTTNRFGVAMSATQTIQNSAHAMKFDPMSFDQGVAESNIPMIVMPNAKSAKEGILLLGSAIETLGVHDKGFGVLIGDQSEAWYLETLSGHQWVAVRIPDNMYFVAANGPGQIQEYAPEKYDYLMSNYQGVDPITYARNHYIDYSNNHIFNFRETFGNIQPAIDDDGNTNRVLYAQSILTPSSQRQQAPMFLIPDELITLDILKKIQSSHYEASPDLDPYRFESGHGRYRAIANFRASNAHITEISTVTDDIAISNTEYIALGMPSISVYIPIYYGLSVIPESLQNTSNEADDNSLFWQFRKLQVLAFLSDPTLGIAYELNAREAYIQERYKALNGYIAQEQKRFLSEYLQDKNPALTAEPTSLRSAACPRSLESASVLDPANKSREVVVGSSIEVKNPEIINAFTQKIVDEISRVNAELIDYFLKKLDVDARYGLKTSQERNRWFTSTLREQECRFRTLPETQCVV